MQVSAWIYLVPIAGIIGLLFAGFLAWRILKKETGTPEMKSIGDAIREGAMAYLARQYKTIAMISVVIAAIIAVFINWQTSIAFLMGAFFSALSGYIGMMVSVNSNMRTANGARKSLKEALGTSFHGGAVSGIAVVSLSLLGVTGVFFLYLNYAVAPGADAISATLDLIVGYAFGASFAALFAQLGGGIYTKAADVGADLVGKVEAGIPEDDPRNPAVIADLVGDNVGDCAGRGADLFESTAAESIGAMLIGAALYIVTGNTNWVFFPLIVQASSLLASLVGIMTVRLRNEDEEPMKAMNRGYIITAAIAMVGFAIITNQLLNNWWYFWCGLVGVALSFVIVYVTQYYTSGAWRPVQNIADASETGPGTNVIMGISIGLESTLFPVLAIAISILAAFSLGEMAAPNGADQFVYGLYGTAAATMGLLSTCTFVLAMDAFGPITDNAGGIIEMSDRA